MLGREHGTRTRKTLVLGQMRMPIPPIPHRWPPKPFAVSKHYLAVWVGGFFMCATLHETLILTGLEVPVRLELTTWKLTASCSTYWAMEPKINNGGAADGTRTRTLFKAWDFLTTLCYHSLNEIGYSTHENSQIFVFKQRHRLLHRFYSLSCSLEHVFTISCDLGSWCMLSTHL